MHLRLRHASLSQRIPEEKQRDRAEVEEQLCQHAGGNCCDTEGYLQIHAPFAHFLPKEAQVMVLRSTCRHAVLCFGLGPISPRCGGQADFDAFKKPKDIYFFLLKLRWRFKKTQKEKDQQNFFPPLQFRKGE